ncbi:MAG: asparaginase domain-containing protein [Lachnospiraceae bacterium]|nr:asparaginase domain-containing protein [Lachnospiraceae bacterium]
MRDGSSEKKILVFLTGGTICSHYDGRVKRQGDVAGTFLEESFTNSSSEYAGKVKFGTTENLGIFSEDMTPGRWNRMIGYMRKLPEIRDTAIRSGSYPSLKDERLISADNAYDGIVIAHGTDTLAYSAALFSILLRDMGVPVFIVSSNEAPQSERSNAAANFRAAVECICEGIRPGVYVTYRNISDGTMYLHYASRLMQCGNFEEDFRSPGMTKLDHIGVKAFSRLPRYDGETDASGCIDLFGDLKIENVVMKIDPYVGLNYDFYDFSGVKAILHGTYHSGTVCTEKADDHGENSVFALLRRCGERPVYIAPSDLTGGIYESVEALEKYSGTANRVRFAGGITAEMLYVKLLLAYSNETLIPDADSFVCGEYNKEFFSPDRGTDN